MLRKYFTLIIIFAINQQVSLEETMMNRVNAHKEGLFQAVRDVLKTTDVIENNYDLIVTEPSKTTATSSVKPVLRQALNRLGLRQGLNKPGLRQGLNKPGLRQGSNRPRLRQGSNKPGLRQTLKRPGLRQTLKRPGLRQGLNKPGLRQGLNKPSSRHYHHHHHHREPPEMVTPVKRKNSNVDRLKTVGVRLRRKKKKTMSSVTTYPRNQENKMATTTLTDELNKNWRSEEEIQEDTEDTGNQKERVKMNQSLTQSYYRRGNFFDDVERNKPQRWTHCMDLISPRLKGYQDDWKRKQISNKDGEFKRLVYLLSTNTSDHTQKELEALLSEISSIRLRIFQWDYTAITTLLNVLIRGPQHTFRALKKGIKNLFESWHLDISMMGLFLDQIRIYRPTCINITGDIGYTKGPGVVNLYTRSPKSTRKPRENLQSCEKRGKKRT